MRRAAAIMCLVSVVFGVAGCSPRQNGLTGVTVDTDGRLIATLAWCDNDPPDGVTLYFDAHGRNSEVARYRAPELNDQTTAFRMDQSDGGWTAEIPMPALDPDIEYWMYGWTEHSTATTGHVRLNADDRARLSVGTILIGEGESVSQAEFERLAGERC